jgi:integrator complex subunit 4
MVDMFNDEIQDVRLKAIESLRKMSASVTLSEDQLETILGALEDFSGEVREGLHTTLGASRLATKICLHMCVTRLLDNLSRYPQDQDSIYNCLASMGTSHPYLTLPLVPQLLGQHPFLDTPEPNVAMPACILLFQIRIFINKIVISLFLIFLFYSYYVMSFFLYCIIL